MVTYTKHIKLPSGPQCGVLRVNDRSDKNALSAYQSVSLALPATLMDAYTAFAPREVANSTGFSGFAQRMKFGQFTSV